jgi:hypothetical protein
MDRATRGTGGLWANNLGGGWTCEPGVTYAGNVGTSCGAQDKAASPASSSYNRTAPMGWVDPGAFDFHLTANSRAVDAGNAQYAPSSDRDGTPRSGAPDAGAYEYDSGRPPTPPDTGGLQLGLLRIQSVRLRPAIICRRARRGCARSARLRVVTSRKARVSVRLSRLRSHHSPRRVRTLTMPAARRSAGRVRARGLARGRYRLRITAAVGGLRSKAVTRSLRVR